MNFTFDIALGSAIFCALGALLSFVAAKISRKHNRMLEVTRAADAPENGNKLQIDGRLLQALRAIRSRALPLLSWDSIHQRPAPLFQPTSAGSTFRSTIVGSAELGSV